MAKKLTPIIKWTGGKFSELDCILPIVPKVFNNYYEPFVGGGAVYMSIDANGYYINDKSDELIDLYRNIANEDEEFYSYINTFNKSWNNITYLVTKDTEFFINLYKKYLTTPIFPENELLEYLNNNEDFLSSIAILSPDIFKKEVKINLFRKIKRMKVLDNVKDKMTDKDIMDNIECAFKSALYMQIRSMYNSPKNNSNSLKSALFFFIRNFAYSGMFRYNAKGEFNVPYGGIGYNSRDITKKVKYLRSPELVKHLQNTVIECMDFKDFINNHTPTSDDFIFLDPPYDTEFSTYAQNEFNKKDQERLAKYLLNCKAKWMMVIKNTDFIYNLYADKGLLITSFDKSYLVNFMNRNDKEVNHLIIRNYSV